MRKVSELLGKPLICLCEGSNEGVIKNITFDKKLQKPKWLILNDRVDEIEFAVSITDVFRHGSDAVIIKSKNELLPAADLGVEINNPINCDVYTTFGKYLGIVKDVLLHETKNETVSLLLDCGELSVGQVFSAGANTVIVLEEEEYLKVVTPKQKTVKPKVAKTAKPREAAKPPVKPLFSPEELFESDPPATEEEWQPPKPEGQKKLIGDYNFLLGRKTNEDIYNKQNEKIIKKHTVITRETVEKARAAGKLIDLTMRSLPEHCVY